MAKVSAKYEVMVVFSLKNGEEPMKALVEKFRRESSVTLKLLRSTRIGVSASLHILSKTRQRATT